MATIRGGDKTTKMQAIIFSLTFIPFTKNISKIRKTLKFDKKPKKKDC